MARRRPQHPLGVQWSPEAALDLHEIVAYLLAQSPVVARAAVTKISGGIERLTTMPRQGRIVPELQRLGIEDWRELIVKPYRIVYTLEPGVEPTTIEIDAVLDSRRDIEALLHRRLSRLV